MWGREGVDEELRALRARSAGHGNRPRTRSAGDSKEEGLQLKQHYSTRSAFRSSHRPNPTVLQERTAIPVPAEALAMQPPPAPMEMDGTHFSVPSSPRPAKTTRPRARHVVSS